MGPPDKREPKASSNIFELPYSNINFPTAMDKINTPISSNVPTLESKEDKDSNSKANTGSTNLPPIVKNHETSKGSANSEGENSLIVFRKVFI